MKKIVLGIFAVGITAAAVALFFFVSREVRITEKDDTKTVRIWRYQTIKVTLASNATTGYSWDLLVAPYQKVLKLVSSEYIAPNTRLAGAGGHEIWIFKPTGPGKTYFKLGYLRPFESKKPPIKKLVVSVEVK